MKNNKQKPDYKKIYEIVRDKFKETPYFSSGPYDETYYTMRVFESTREIIEKLDEEVNEKLVLTSAILHDVGKSALDMEKVFGEDIDKEEKEKHPELGVPIATEILKTFGHSDKFIDQVCYLVRNHDKRGNKMENRTIELKILQDADLLADIGLAGFIRPFLYAGSWNRSTIESIEFLFEWKDKLINKDKLNLEISKQIADEKTKLQKDLILKAKEDIESELLN